MEALKAGWNFFQGQILGMKWLYQLIGTLLNACGLDTSTPIGGSVHFSYTTPLKLCCC